MAPHHANDEYYEGLPDRDMFRSPSYNQTVRVQLDVVLDQDTISAGQFMDAMREAVENIRGTRLVRYDVRVEEEY